MLIPTPVPLRSHAPGIAEGTGQPNAHVQTYADAGHGFLGQYPELFAEHINAFLR